MAMDGESSSTSSRVKDWFLSSPLARIKLAKWASPAVLTDWLASVILLVIGRHLADQLPFQQPIKPFLGDPTVSLAMALSRTPTLPHLTSPFVALMPPFYL